MQIFHNCIACRSACSRLHHQRLPRLQIEFATSNVKKRRTRKKRVKKGADQTALKLYPIWCANAHPENLKLLSHWEKKEQN